MTTTCSSAPTVLLVGAEDPICLPGRREPDTEYLGNVEVVNIEPGRVYPRAGDLFVVDIPILFSFIWFAMNYGRPGGLVGTLDTF